MSFEFFKRNMFGVGYITSPVISLDNVSKNVNQIEFKFWKNEIERTITISDIYLESGKYAYETNTGLQSSFGWEGDYDAPISFVDGCFRLRNDYDHIITFGIKDIPGKIDWYNAEGYLPCFVSKFSKDGIDYTIENFANKHEIDGKAYELVCSRMTAKNNTDNKVALPIVSRELMPLNAAAKNEKYVKPHQPNVREYTICADRFGKFYAYPDADILTKQGGFDENYEAMKKILER